MRIAYDYQIFWWQEYGGISRYYFELARALGSMGCHTVAVLAPLYVNRYLREAQEGVRVVGVPVPPLRGSGRIYRALAEMSAGILLAGFRPDVVHETYYSSVRRAPRGARLVLTVFDMIHERFPEAFAAGDPTGLEKAAAVRRADHVICISEHTRRDLIEVLGVPEEKTSVVYLASSMTGTQRAQRAAFEKPYLLYVGSRQGYKNFSSLLRAYSRSTMLRQNFLLVCFGGGAFSSEEMQIQKKLGISVLNVRHLGGGDKMLASLYAGAEVFVCPSIYEGFGIPPLEAMSMGCPVACSTASSLPEVVGDAAEMFDPLNEDEIGAAIERTVTSEDKRAQMVRRGRDRARLFSWKKCAEQTLAVYQEQPVTEAK